MIANCGHDEHYRYWGGQAGDQTGNEWAVAPWWDDDWDFVARHPNAAVRERLATYAEHAANNDLIGYDQGGRLSFYYALANDTATGDPAEITEAVEADCSSGVAAIVILAGWQLEREGAIDAQTAAKLKGVSPSMTTYVERDELTRAGFEIIEEASVLRSQDRLVRGDILCNEQVHTTINLTTGASADIAQANGAIAEDGWWGCATSSALQRFFGTVEDGVISSQNEGHRGILVACTTGWEWVGDAQGSPVIRAVQARIGAEQDGIMGPETISKLEIHFGTQADGHLDGPSLTVQRMQAALNRGEF